MNNERLTAEEKKLLLKLARETINENIRKEKSSRREITRERLQSQQGCFVSIKVAGELRGCIGNFTPDKPLFQLVQEMAVSAATRDPRFYPMKIEDLDNFNLEISVLSPLEKITAVEDILIGVHGLYIEKNFSRGVLLPQVAVEYGWDRDTFLRQTCLKAGLKADAWQEGTDIYTFRAEVFNDNNHG